MLNITRYTGTRIRLSSFYKDKWWPSIFPEGEKSLNPFVHQNMLFLHGTRLSCPPCNSPQSPREQKWNPSSHDITYHSAFLLLQSSQRRLHQESLSHNAAQAAANDLRTLGGLRSLLRSTWEDGWQPSGLGRALKLAPAQVTKAGQVPLHDNTFVNDF